MLVKSTSVVNFTNILWAAFLYKSYMCSIFVLVWHYTLFGTRKLAEKVLLKCWWNGLQFDLRRRTEMGRWQPLGDKGRQEGCSRSGRVSHQGHPWKANLGKIREVCIFFFFLRPKKIEAFDFKDLWPNSTITNELSEFHKWYKNHAFQFWLPYILAYKPTPCSGRTYKV